jgi:hypothetical protein
MVVCSFILVEKALTTFFFIYACKDDSLVRIVLLLNVAAYISDIYEWISTCGHFYRHIYYNRHFVILDFQYL